MQTKIDFVSIFNTWTKSLPQLNPPLPHEQPSTATQQELQSSPIYNDYIEFLSEIGPICDQLGTMSHEENTHFYHFTSLSPLKIQYLTRVFLQKLLNSIFENLGHQEKIDFAYMYDINNQDENNSNNNNDKTNNNNPPPSPSPNPIHPLSIVQFNMLADHLSGSHPQYGNFEGIDVKSLAMIEYRQWKILDLLIANNSFISPQSNNITSNDEGYNDIKKDIIAIEELDTSFYLSFFGPILALLGYHSSFSPKHLKLSGCCEKGKEEIKETRKKEFVTGDGTGIFSLYPIHDRKHFHLSANMSQIAVGILVNVSKSVDLTADNNDDGKYVFVVATHLKAEKSPDGERIRSQQITQLYQQMGGYLNNIINIHEKSLTSLSGKDDKDVVVNASQPLNHLHSTIKSTITKEYNQTSKSITYPGLSKCNNTIDAVVPNDNCNNNDKSDKSIQELNKSYNLSVIICGDFNAAPYQTNITPYTPDTYYSASKDIISIDSVGCGENNDDYDEMKKKNQLQISFKSVYTNYNQFYNNYITKSKLGTSFTTGINNNTFQNQQGDDKKDQADQLFSKIEPPLVHLPGYPDSPIPYPEAPYTTMKTRGAKLFKHTIDYIWYNSDDKEQTGYHSFLRQPKLIALGTLPNSQTTLPPCGLPDWIFPSDHLPLMGLFDLE